MARSIFSLDTITGSYDISTNLLVSGTNLIVSGTLSVTGSTYLKSTQVEGRLISSAGLSGSLTKLSDGSSYLVAGTGTTVTTGSNGAVTVSVAASGGSSKAIAYNGYCTGSMLWSSTTWADFHTVPGNFTDTFQNGITRSGSTFTVVSGGIYFFRSDFNHGNAYSYTGFRLSGSNGTIIQQTNFSSRYYQEGDGADLTGVFSLPAGGSFKLQYAFKLFGLAPIVWSPSDPLNGEIMRSGAICIYRIGTS
jgi:hypothetical protein